ncbi:T-cell-specific guanine nucleotide triphosphate-binding protein 2-like [Mercenaria mercenaria]|uniref:T-cell-specific guanine nucleotide triphosphate-binding protein 2-like n=1 Tax=Mercenaria mercenaria TaxID=6596 RepID=UPI00234E3C43|nr:T-cell-specific guanine nucleotide triphosphate-binding protein 2-like [Mercenaria mercenaria]
MSDIIAKTQRLSTTESSEDSQSFMSADTSIGSDEYIEDILWFEWNDDQALRDHLSRHGTRNIASLLDDSLEAWKRKSVNIAVIGQSGKGKSSLINALRGLTEADKDAAAVGEQETTRKCTPYSHPKYNNIMYWDIPGCSKETFEKKKYLQQINYRYYDYFLIVSSERFLEADIWLAKELMEKGKRDRCYFIRSKVDIDMASRRRRAMLQNEIFDERQAFQDFQVVVKADMFKALGDSTPFQLFLLSSHFPNRYEFQNLQVKLVVDALAEKRFSLAFGMNSLAQPLLDYKRRVLSDRRKKVALQACSCMPETPSGLKIVSTRLPSINAELEFYKEQLSLDDTGLNTVACRAGVTVQDLRRTVELNAPVLSDSEISNILLEKYRYYLEKEGKKPLGKTKLFFTGQQKIAFKAISKFLDEQMNTYIKDTDKLIDYVKTTTENNTV